MTKVLKINKRQLGLVLNYVSESKKSKEIIEEGWKEVVLGTAMLLGLNLGASAQKGQAALDDEVVLKQIGQTLDDSDGIEKLASTLDVNSKELQNYMQKNADKIEANFNMAAKKKNVSFALNLHSYDNPKDVKTDLSRGYALVDAWEKFDTIYTEPLPANAIVSISDSVVIDLSSGEGFKTFESKLSPQAEQEIKDAVTKIKSANGRLIIVKVESSTDKQRTPSYISQTDPSGNITLSNKRGENALKAIKALGIDLGNSKVDIKTTPDMGNTSMEEFMKADQMAQNGSTDLLQSLQQKEALHRSVKVTFVYVIDIEVENGQTIPQIYQIIPKFGATMAKSSAIDGKGNPIVDKGNGGGSPNGKCRIKWPQKYKGTKSTTGCGYN